MYGESASSMKLAIAISRTELSERSPGLIERLYGNSPVEHRRYF